MTSKKMSPATFADADRARNSSCLLASDGFEIISSLPEIQSRRAAWLARRFQVSPSIAATLAPIVFGSGAAR